METAICFVDFFMEQLVRNVRIAGTGSYVPDQVYTNKYLETLCATNDAWIQSNLGIKERRVALPDECVSDMAARAGLCAVDDAGLSVQDIDLIIVATATPDRKAPATATIVQYKMQADNAAAFDISAVCSGFLFAMSIGSQYIASHVYHHVLVIGADKFSSIIDWTRRDSVFFGDGAGAVVLSASKVGEGFLASRIYTDTKQNHFGFTVPAGGSEIPITKEVLDSGLQYFQMDGKAVFQSAIEVLPKAIRQVLSDANMSIDEVDMLILHQPSIKILIKTAEILGFPFDKVMHNMEKYANTSSGTIPILLDETNKQGKVKRGDNILFAAVGSGWTYGAAILKWS